MNASNLPQEPGEKPRPLPPGAELPRSSPSWLRRLFGMRRATSPLVGRVAGAGRSLRRGTVNVVTIRHDGWCPAIRTSSMLDCLCAPDVEAPREVA